MSEHHEPEAPTTASGAGVTAMVIAEPAFLVPVADDTRCSSDAGATDASAPNPASPGAEALTWFACRVRNGDVPTQVQDPGDDSTGPASSAGSASTPRIISTSPSRGAFEGIDAELLGHAHVTLILDRITIACVHELLRRPGVTCTERLLGLASSEDRTVPPVAQDDPYLTSLFQDMGEAATSAEHHMRRDLRGSSAATASAGSEPVNSATTTSAQDASARSSAMHDVLRRKHKLEALASLRTLAARTTVLVTASLHTWMDVLAYCFSGRASTDMRAVGLTCLTCLHERYPRLIPERPSEMS